VDVTLDLTRQMIEVGSDEIAIADTIGAGHPQQMKDIMAPLIQQYGAEKFFIHLHDTRGLASALAWTACDLGVRKFDASVGGLGGCPFAPGATGNVATEDVVYMLHGMGIETGLDLNRLVQTGKIIRWIESQEARGRPCDLT